MGENYFKNKEENIKIAKQRLDTIKNNKNFKVFKSTFY